MLWKRKDNVFGCCASCRRQTDDDDIVDAKKQTAKVVLMKRPTDELSSPVKKLNIPSAIMETSSNRQDSKENLPNPNGVRYSTGLKQTTSRLDRSSSRNNDERETNIPSSNTATSLSEQAKPIELASNFVSMGLLNDSEAHKLNTTFEALGSSSESVERNASKTESYKMKKQSYYTQKKRITSETANLLKDSSVVIVSDWLKVRGTLRDWTKLWAILKPGLMLLYRNSPPKNGVWVGTVVLSSCEVMQRPSKKQGFCFKIWHPLEKSIWAQRGPNNEQFGAFTFPLPMNYLICRASDETAGRCWIDALELTMKCSKLLKKPIHSPMPNDEISTQTQISASPSAAANEVAFINTSFSDDCELSRATTKDEEDRMSEASVDISKASRSGSSHSESSQEILNEDDSETPYVAAPPEEMGELGNVAQTEEVPEENKSLIVHLLKQVRPGMDLSRVVLPTFILEPRSFLEKLSDYYYHCDMLEEAVNSSDPLIRMRTVVKFYLSGFYKKPKGLKKPYNPVIGEVYRCFFYHPKTDSKTFYLAEQISHHPPITNFYVSNRKEGFAVQGNILAKSKFYGNSIAAILDGSARLTLLNRGEDYVITMPYANCKGIIIGKPTMELGGKVTIVCEKTRYSADIEFKLKPFIGGQELTNHIEGKIRLEDDVIYTFSGHWDDEITIVDKAANTKSVFWKVTQTVVNSRLKRYVVPIEQQNDNESEKLWQRVTIAIRQNDQISATEEKTIIEDEQRRQVKERKTTGVEWRPRLFSIDPNTKEWTYNYADSHPWDAHNDISTYENNFIICTRTRHRAQKTTHQNQSSSRNNSIISNVGLSSSLNHGPPLTINNMRANNENQCVQPTGTQQTSMIMQSTNDLSSILQRVDTTLVRINQRLDSLERDMNLLKTHRLKLEHNNSNSYSSYFQLILIIVVAIILKYIFN